MNQYKDKTLLIISGCAQAVPIIKFAKEKGLRIVVSDGDPDAPGFKLADEKLVASTFNVVESAREAKKSSENIRIDGVMSAAIDVPYTVAYVAKELGLYSIGVESAKYAMDKLLMKGLFRDANVPIGRFSTVNSFDHLERILPEITTSVVMKPTDSRGARGIVRLGRGVTPLRAYEEAVAQSPSGTCMIEEWIDGPQISTESVLTPDGISTPGLSLRNYDRLDEFFPYVIEDGGDLPADISETLKIEIDDLIQSAASALNITRGIIKGDIVLSSNGPLVIEIAPRLSGGFFCTHTGPLSSGVDIVEAAIDFALGLDVDYKKYKPVFDTFVCQRFLFSEQGLVKEVKLKDSLKNDRSVAFYNISVKEGDVIEKTTSHPCRVGSVITTGVSAIEARKAAKQALEAIEIIVESPGSDNA